MSNIPTSNFTVLWCWLLCSLGVWLRCVVCPKCITDCYFYSQENRLIYMASFWLCYNLNKHTSDYDSILWLRPASCAIVVIGPLIRMNIYGIVTSPWTCRQPGHLGSRSDCQAIDTAWLDASMDLKPHASGFLLLLHTPWPWSSDTSLTRCHTRLVMYLIHIDDPTTGVNYCAAVMSLGTFFWKAEPSVYHVHDARFTKRRS
jgi:hypothetical protein